MDGCNYLVQASVVLRDFLHSLFMSSEKQSLPNSIPPYHSKSHLACSGTWQFDSTSRFPATRGAWKSGQGSGCARRRQENWMFQCRPNMRVADLLQQLRAVRICVAGCFNCTEGDPSLVAVTLHSHITVSPATCHPVQCRENMTVADCASV